MDDLSIDELKETIDKYKSALSTLENSLKEKKRLASLPSVERIAERLHNHECGGGDYCNWDNHKGGCYKEYMEKAEKLLKLFSYEARVNEVLEIIEG